MVLLQVREQFEARVIFPQKGSDDDTEVITIIGRKENADAAKAHLLKLIKDLVSMYNLALGLNALCCAGLLIKILTHTHYGTCTMIVTTLLPPPSLLLPPTSLSQDKVVEVEVHVDCKYHRHFIQSRGKVSQQLQEELLVCAQTLAIPSNLHV